MASQKLAKKRAPKVKRPISPSSHEPSVPPSGTADNLTRRHTRTAKRVRFQDDDASIRTAQAPAEQRPVATHGAVEPHIQDHHTPDSDIEIAPAQPRVAAAKAKALHAEIAANEANFDNTDADTDYDTSDLYASPTPSIQVQPTKTMQTKPPMAKVSAGSPI